MALRAVSLSEAPRRLTLSRDTWRKQVEATVAQGALALRSDDTETFGALFEEISGWGDQHRAYQARRQLAELAFAAAEKYDRDAWTELFVLVGGKLVDVLEREPSEPLLLNYLAVMLYEVGEIRSAHALFTAAAKLDPELEHVHDNRQAARRRLRSVPPVLAPGLRARARTVAVRALAISKRAKPANGQTLSLVMIVKNEEEMLPGCLEAVRGAVDEMVIVDTGSTDRTVEIAESFGAKVVDFPWNGSFADARNCSLDHATGDWVVYLDADEHLVPEDAPKLRRLVNRTWREAFYLVETNYTGGDDSGSAVAHLAMRVFKRKPDYRFEGRIHEQKTQAMPTFLPERFETTEIRIMHYGYLKSRITAKEKSRRNIELLAVEALEAPGPFVDFNLGSEYMAVGEFATARTYLDRGWDLLRREEGWSGKGYAPMLAARVVQARRECADTEAARRAIDEGLIRFPEHTELVLQAGLCARADGDLEEAARFAERCLELGDPPAKYSPTVGCGTYLAQCLLAQVRIEQGRAEEGEAVYRQSLSEHPDYVAPVLPLAASMLGRGVAAGRGARRDRCRPSERAAARRDRAGRGRASRRSRGRLPCTCSSARPEHSVARIGLVETLLARRDYDRAATEAALEPAGSPLEAAASAAELFARAAAGRLSELGEALERAPGRGVPQAEIELYARLGGRRSPARRSLR